MRKIKAVPITAENFKPYGTFYNMLEPSGNCFPGDGSAFYPDHVLYSMPSVSQVAFSALTSNKSDRMIITKSEYHNHSGECMLFMDDDVVIHVAPPSNHVITPEKTEAFIVPKGTLVKINTAVWHLSPWPIHNDIVHVMIILPERVYGNDCYVCDFPEEDWIEVTL